MSSSFLQKFQGKTQRLTKTGLNSLFSDRNNSPPNYFTNTRHSNSYIREKNTIYTTPPTRMKVLEDMLLDDDKLKPEIATTSTEICIRPREHHHSKQAKENKKQPKEIWSKLGGLGPNIGTQEWEARNKKQSKMLEYAKKLKLSQIKKKRVKAQQDTDDIWMSPSRQKPQQTSFLNDIEADPLSRLESQFFRERYAPLHF